MGKKKVELKDMVTELTILGKKVAVDIKSDSGMKTEFMGLYLPHDQKIEIKGGLPYETQLSVLLHESIEALESDMELGLEHSQIASLEVGIFQVLRDNPALCEAFLANKG